MRDPAVLDRAVARRGHAERQIEVACAERKRFAGLAQRRAESIRIVETDAPAERGATEQMGIGRAMPRRHRDRAWCWLGRLRVLRKACLCREQRAKQSGKLA